MTKQTAEDEKKYKKALRFIYKYGQETNKLTEEAVEACKRQSINTDDLIFKTVEDFAVNVAATTQTPKNKHQMDLLESENNLSSVRYKHHENRRRILVMRLYEYLCVMSTIPTLNPQLALANTNTKSKTTLGSGGANLNTLTMKSNRNKISPFKADKQLLNTEMSRISKDETRNNFQSLVGNLPSIKKQPLRAKNPGPPASQAVKKIKRKAEIPAEAIKPQRASVSIAGSAPMQADSVGEAVTASQTQKESVTKMAQSHGSQYPGYFYKPQENIFDAKRGSRYDKGHQPKAFHLTQPDANMAKVVFINHESKKRNNETSSMINGSLNKDFNMVSGFKSPRS